MIREKIEEYIDNITKGTFGFVKRRILKRKSFIDKLEKTLVSQYEEAFGEKGKEILSLAFEYYDLVNKLVEEKGYEIEKFRYFTCFLYTDKKDLNVKKEFLRNNLIKLSFFDFNSKSDAEKCLENQRKRLLEMKLNEKDEETIKIIERLDNILARVKELLFV
jgi:hypothetical protein